MLMTFKNEFKNSLLPSGAPSGVSPSSLLSLLSLMDPLLLNGACKASSIMLETSSSVTEI